MEETTCPLTEGKAIEICSENFGDDCGYILENLFIKCKYRHLILLLILLTILILLKKLN